MSAFRDKIIHCNAACIVFGEGYCNDATSALSGAGDKGYLAIGPPLLETFDAMIERALAYKEKHGWDSIYDMQYADLVRDPIGEIRKIYQHFGEPFTADTEDYGLTPEGVRERYRDYCERFAIPAKS